MEGRGPRGLDAAPGRIPGRASEGADALKREMSHCCDGHAQGPRAVPLLPRALPSHDHPSSSPRKLPPPAPPASGLPRSTPSVPVPSSGRGLALTVRHAPGILRSWGRRQAAAPAPRRGGCAPGTGDLRLPRAVCATDGPQLHTGAHSCVLSTHTRLGRSQRRSHSVAGARSGGRDPRAAETHFVHKSGGEKAVWSLTEQGRNTKGLPVENHKGFQRNRPGDVSCWEDGVAGGR